MRVLLIFTPQQSFKICQKGEKYDKEKINLGISFNIYAICTSNAFVLCLWGGDKHLISKDWSKNESQHWHACTGKNCDEKHDLAEHEFVWTEKTPAGLHVDKVEEGTCSTCNFKIDRKVPNTATHTYETESWEKDKTGHWHKSTCDETDPTHQGLKNDFAEHTYGAWAVKTPAEFHKNRVDHRLCSVCGFEDTKEVPDTMEHTWEYVYNDKEYHWEETICSGHDKLTRNKEKHTTKWHILNNEKHQLVTDCKEHGLYSIKTENHRYDSVDDTTCNDCGFDRGPAGKGSFKVNTFEAKTYNDREQAAVSSSDYTVNEAIKSLCEIQYKVKGASDSTFTATVPTNAGTYEVRIYCRGNDIYLEGEVAKAKTDYVINKYKVEIARNLSFNVAYDKAAMEDDNVQYIHLGTVTVSEGLVNPVDVPIKAPKRDDNKNPGRNPVRVDYLLTEDDNFAIKELPLSDTNRKVNLVHYNDNVVATLTSKDETNVKWDETKKQVGITVTRVNDGTIRVGDYMMCEGYTKPLKVVALKLEYNVPTDILVNADKNCEIYFDNSSFADLATAKPILANKTFTEVETLNFVEGKNYTNTVSRQLNKGEKFYLAFTTEASANLKTYKLNFNTNGTGYVTTSDSVVFYREDGSGVSGGYELNVTTPDGVLYFVTVTKTADSEAGKESVDFYITKR